MKALLGGFIVMALGATQLALDSPAGVLVGHDDLRLISGGAFTRCQDPGPPAAGQYTACNHCNPVTHETKCTSTDIATVCKAYTNPYACVECEAGTLSCTGNLEKYPLTNCAGPPQVLGTCARVVLKANHQACTGQCP